MNEVYCFLCLLTQGIEFVLAPFDRSIVQYLQVLTVAAEKLASPEILRSVLY